MDLKSFFGKKDISLEELYLLSKTLGLKLRVTIQNEIKNGEK